MVEKHGETNTITFSAVIGTCNEVGKYGKMDAFTLDRPVAGKHAIMHFCSLSLTTAL